MSGRRYKKNSGTVLKKPTLEQLEKRHLLAADFSLELLHFSDQEAGAAAVVDAPNLSAVLNALRDQDLGSDGVADNTLTLSSGDAIIPGLFFDASEAVFGSKGVADILIQNELGIQAMALGNHEFDLGTDFLAGLISGSALAGFDGTSFPYLSSNLDFTNDAFLNPLVVADGSAPATNSLSGSTVIDVNGEMIGIVGATTPILDEISSPGDVEISPATFGGVPTSEELDALAAVIQADVDALIAANTGLDKVILLAHMQTLDIEQGLAERLSNVDIIVAGGSNTRLFDSNDRARAGDTPQGEYPQFFTDVDGSPVALVNTDGNYKYVGRLVIDFENGNILPDSYDAIVSGAYATDAQGVSDLGGTADPEVQAIADAIGAQIIATDGNFFGVTDVFLNGFRTGGGTDGVRNQETNLGNLTADANLAAAKAVDSTVVASFKNGGGIRANIGEIVVPPGGTQPVRLPPSGNPLSGRPEGGISQNAIASTLAFNNGLVLLTLTKAELVSVLEHAINGANDDPDSGQGRFPQISGVNFSYDVDLPAGERVISAAIVDDGGNVVSELVRNGEISGRSDETFRIVTLDFLAGGGDGFPFGSLSNPNRIDLERDPGDPRTGAATFAEDGSEQDALAEYLQANFSVTPFAQTDVTPTEDSRIQNLDFRPDTVLAPKVRGNTVFVTNSFDAGVGSLRHSLGVAAARAGIDRIVFESSIDSIQIDSPLAYESSDRLVILDNGVTIQASESFAGEALFVSSGGADLSMRGVTFDGGLSVGSEAADDHGAHGIFIPVPAETTGVLKVSLDGVNIANNGLFGLWIADQLNDSAASIDLFMQNVNVINNGIAALDFDGVRVDEGGSGSLHATIRGSSIVANGGDGLELDERGDGNVKMHVRDSFFTQNGFFDVEDLDDGLDIDEAGPGSIVAILNNVLLNDNEDEGLDLDEEDSGDLRVFGVGLEANGNVDEGIKLSELGAGSVVARFRDVEANFNGDDGIEVEEEEDEGTGENLGSVFVNLFMVLANGNGSEGLQITEFGTGRLDARLDQVEANGNSGAGIQLEELGRGGLFFSLNQVTSNQNSEDGLKVEESGNGTLSGVIRNANFSQNAFSGMDLSEEDAGSFWILVFSSQISGNDQYGVEASQESGAIGILLFRQVTLNGNVVGATDLNNVTLIGA